MAGPENLTFDEFVETSSRAATGATGTVNHVPLPMLRLMSVILRPIKPVLAGQMAAAVVMDTPRHDRRHAPNGRGVSRASRRRRCARWRRASSVTRRRVRPGPLAAADASRSVAHRALVIGRAAQRLRFDVGRRAAERAAMVEHARAVIIGGGVGGTLIAYHLTELGWTDIVLVDRAELTSGSTFHSAGLVGPAAELGHADQDDDVRRPTSTGGWRPRPARTRRGTRSARSGWRRARSGSRSSAARPAGPRRSACRSS